MKPGYEAEFGTLTGSELVAGIKEVVVSTEALQERIQDGSGRVGHRKQLAMLFGCQFHTQGCKPAHGRCRVERRQDVLNDVAGAVEVGRRYMVVGDVAPAATRDQNLGSCLFGAFEQEYLPRWPTCLGRENRRRQSGRSASDDDDIRDVHA